MKFWFWNRKPRAAPQGEEQNQATEENNEVVALEEEPVVQQCQEAVLPCEPQMDETLHRVKKPKRAAQKMARKMERKSKKMKNLQQIIKDAARSEKEDFKDVIFECGGPYDIFHKRYVTAPRDAVCACPVKVQSSCCGEDCPPKRQQSCCVEPGICDSIGFKNFLKEFRCKNDQLSRCAGLEAARCIYNNMDECTKKCYRLKGCIPPRCKPCCIPFVPITKAVRRPYCKPCGF